MTYEDDRNSITAAYANNDANEYTSIEDVGGGGVPVNVYYDDIGNLSKDENEYEYSYDYDNRLTQIDYTAGSPITVAHYEYDALGRVQPSATRLPVRHELGVALTALS